MPGLAEKRKEMLDAYTREAIYEAAVNVLTQHGLSGATMDRVAAEAGIAKGSLYKYFRTKRALLEFVHNRAIEPLQEALRDLVGQPLSAVEKLTRIVRLWRERLIENRPLFEFLCNDRAVQSLVRDSEMTARTLAVQQIEAIIRQGIEQGDFRPVDPRLAADLFVGAAIGMTEHELETGQVREVDEAVHSLIDIFVHGLAAPLPPSGGEQDRERRCSSDSSATAEPGRQGQTDER